MRPFVLALLSLSVGCVYDFDQFTPTSGDAGAAVDTGAVDSGGACPGKSSGGHCYFTTSGALGFAAAKAACEGAGGHLATVSSSAEEGVVESVGSGERWIGLSRPAGSPNKADSFAWITGEPITYFKWAPTQPAGAGECALIRASGGWADGACANALVGVCER